MSETTRTPLKALPTRERILRAGLHLFQTQGYHGTGVSEILERARAPKGSLYHHFPGGKEELAITALRWLEGEILEFLGQAGGSEAMVLGLARRMADGLRSGALMRGSLMAVLAQEAAPGSPAIEAALREFSAAIRQRLAEARAREGERTPEAFADQALAIVQGAAVLARVEREPARAEAIVAAWLKSAGG